MEKFKWLFAIVGGALSTFSRQYGLILLFVAMVICLDVITGLVKAKATGEAISSQKGTRGFWKKVALFVGLCFGFFLDYFIPFMLGTIGITLPVNGAIFGMIIGCYIVINESISIAENLYLTNPDILPKWIKNMLISAKDQVDNIDKKEDK
jgi:toxin secretion/phage lysis holin